MVEEGLWLTLAFAVLMYAGLGLAILDKSEPLPLRRRVK
jgi:hypothetical protein